MTQDPNKKSLRSFQCRDYLWEIFEQMGHELECSVDYLVNEAMRQYARSRNYGVRGPSSAPGPRPSGHPAGPMPPMGPGGGRPSIPSAPPPPPQRGGAPPPQPGGYGGYPAQPHYSGGGYGPGGHYPPSAPAAASYPAPPPSHRPPAYPSGAPPHGASPSAAPPPLPGQHRGQAPQPGHPPPLYVIFNGQKIPIIKNEFVIGRGSKTADLPIKDGNISRRHAAVVFQEGAFYLKDLGSTNGVEYGGRRVDSKRIDEGDVFQICDYELRFTYR